MERFDDDYMNEATSLEELEALNDKLQDKTEFNKWKKDLKVRVNISSVFISKLYCKCNTKNKILKLIIIFYWY